MPMRVEHIASAIAVQRTFRAFDFLPCLTSIRLMAELSRTRKVCTIRSQNRVYPSKSAFSVADS